MSSDAAALARDPAPATAATSDVAEAGIAARSGAACRELPLAARPACFERLVEALEASRRQALDRRAALARALLQAMRERARMEATSRRLRRLAATLAKRQVALARLRVREREKLVETESRYRRLLPELVAALRARGAQERRARGTLLLLGRELAEARARDARSVRQLARAAATRGLLLAGAERIRRLAWTRQDRANRLQRERVRLTERAAGLAAGITRLEAAARDARILLALANATRHGQLAARVTGRTGASLRPASSPPRRLPSYPPLLAEAGHVGTAARLADAQLAPGVADPAIMASEGHVLARFGERAGGLPSRGLVLAAAEPLTVRAPRAGRVVFAGPLRGLGLVLILDHGGGYHSVFAGLGRISVARGTDLTDGDLLGLVVPVRGRPGRLYVELRYRGRPVDPLRGLASLSTDRHSG